VVTPLALQGHAVAQVGRQRGGRQPGREDKHVGSVHLVQAARPYRGAALDVERPQRIARHHPAGRNEQVHQRRDQAQRIDRVRVLRKEQAAHEPWRQVRIELAQGVRAQGQDDDPLRLPQSPRDLLGRAGRRIAPDIQLAGLFDQAGVTVLQQVVVQVERRRMQRAHGGRDPRHPCRAARRHPAQQPG
jgi:hypothetical protein